MTQADGVAETDSAVQRALQARFPATTFAVRSSGDSGPSIDVRWTDGPTAGLVREVAQAVAGATARVVRAHREYSDVFWAKVARAVAERFGCEVPRRAEAAQVWVFGEWFSTLVHRAAEDRSWLAA